MAGIPNYPSMSSQTTRAVAGIEGDLDSINPDVVLPSQTSRRALHTPEKRLQLAVLEDALRTYQRTQGATTTKRRMAHEEARHWLLDAPGERFAFTCEDICDYLDIDLSALRTAVRNHQGVIERRRPVVGNYPIRVEYHMRRVRKKK